MHLKKYTTTHVSKFLDPPQPNPWMDPTHVHYLEFGRSPNSLELLRQSILQVTCPSCCPTDSIRSLKDVFLTRDSKLPPCSHDGSAAMWCLCGLPNPAFQFNRTSRCDNESVPHLVTATKCKKPNYSKTYKEALHYLGLYKSAYNTYRSRKQNVLP